LKFPKQEIGPHWLLMFRTICRLHIVTVLQFFGELSNLKSVYVLSNFPVALIVT